MSKPKSSKQHFGCKFTENLNKFYALIPYIFDTSPPLLAEPKAAFWSPRPQFEPSTIPYRRPHSFPVPSTMLPASICGLHFHGCNPCSAQIVRWTCSMNNLSNADWHPPNLNFHLCRRAQQNGPIPRLKIKYILQKKIEKTCKHRRSMDKRRWP